MIINKKLLLGMVKKNYRNYSIDFYKKNNQFKQEDFDTTLYKIEENETTYSENLDFNDLKVKQILEIINSLKYNYQNGFDLIFY